MPVAPVAAPQPAPAQSVTCRPRDFVLGQLAQRYNEAPVAVGLTNRGALVEVLTTPDGKTWTIIISSPDGMSCLVEAGENWRFLPRTDPRIDPRT